MQVKTQKTVAETLCIFAISWIFGFLCMGVLGIGMWGLIPNIAFLLWFMPKLEILK